MKTKNVLWLVGILVVFLIIGWSLSSLKDVSIEGALNDEETATSSEEETRDEPTPPATNEIKNTYTPSTYVPPVYTPPPTETSEQRFSNVTSAKVVSTLNVLPPIYRVFVNGTYDKTCQYTASTEQTLAGRTFVITIKYNERSGLICLEKESPFEEKITLKNTADLPPGLYNVSVNGVTTSFDLTD